MFDGETYDRALDRDRLKTQLERVKAHMLRGGWTTLEALAELSGGSVPGVSARLRDMRKDKFGGYTVERRRVGGGLYEYRVLAPPARPVQLQLV